MARFGYAVLVYEIGLLVAWDKWWGKLGLVILNRALILLVWGRNGVLWMRWKRKETGHEGERWEAEWKGRLVKNLEG